ncbi:MAG: hypothetical protein MHMPM18_004931 [Marteilia pararefringens]
MNAQWIMYMIITCAIIFFFTSLKSSIRSTQQAQQAPPSTSLVAKIKDSTHKGAAQSSNSAEGESQNDSQNRKSSVSSIYVSPESPISEPRDNDRSKDKLHSAGNVGN